MPTSFDQVRGSRSLPPFVGREAELTVLRQCFARAVAGDGNLVLISGEAGIGKTSLVRALVGGIQQEALVLSGHCYDLSKTPPYGPWFELTARFNRVQDVPELPERLIQGTRFEELTSQLALFEVARDFFQSVAKQRPLVLVLEDLHWSDQESLELLRFVARSLEGNRILLMATYREDDLTRRHPLFMLLPSLNRETQATRIELRSLTVADVHALVDLYYSLSAGDKARLVDYLLTHAEGNPLFTVEILRTLEQKGLLRSSGDDWKVSDLRQVPMPSLVRQVIERRLAQLKEQAIHMLEMAAVIGHVVPLDLWQAVSGANESEFNASLEQAIEAHVLVEVPGRPELRFSHWLVREAVYERIPMLLRRQWHRQLGDTLSAMPNPDPDVVAYHFQQAGDHRAVDWFIRAGERAERSYALLTACERFATAAEMLREDPSRALDRGWLLYVLACYQGWTEPVASIATIDEAYHVFTTAGNRAFAAMALFDGGWMRYFAGQYERGLANMEAGLADLDALTDDERSITPRAVPGFPYFFQRANGSYVAMLAVAGQLAEARQRGEKLLAQPAGIDPDCYFGLGVTYATLGMPAESKRMIARARTERRQYGPMLILGYLVLGELVARALPYAANDRHELAHLLTEADEAFQVASSEFTMSVKPGEVPLLFVTGDWDRAEEVTLCGPWALEIFVYVPTYVRATIAQARGDLEEAWRLVHNVFPEGPRATPGDRPFLFATPFVRLGVELALDVCDLHNARAWLDTHDRWLAWNGAVLGRAEGELLWARYHRVAGDLDLARQHASQSLNHSSEPRQPLALLAAHRFLGGLDTAEAHYADAEPHLQEALALADSCAAPFERALTLLPFAELNAAIGNTQEALSLLEEVQHICTPLNARPTLDRARRLASSLTTQSGAAPLGLTPRELEVLRLIAQGRTDREIADELFISRHTVMRHVSHILAKLNVDSRTAAAAEAVRNHIV
jgi:DNA-binding CsgD family transcriptional regulator